MRDGYSEYLLGSRETMNTPPPQKKILNRSASISRITQMAAKNTRKNPMPGCLYATPPSADHDTTFWFGTQEIPCVANAVSKPVSIIGVV